MVTSEAAPWRHTRSSGITADELPFRFVRSGDDRAAVLEMM